MDETTQNCTDCSATLPLSRYFLTSAQKPMKHCKDCHRERTKKWRAANPEKTRKHKADSYAKRGEKAREYARTYYQSEHGRANQDAWRQANRERIRENERQYRAGVYRWVMVERKYGLTQENYEAMESAQDGRCAICLLSLLDVRVHIDHCHETNRVRGLLCSKCNQALGLLMERSSNAARAAWYLAET